jgi:hypothetical protein
MSLALVQNSSPALPRSEQVKLWFYSNAILGETMRSRQLDRYEAHYSCRQYNHLELDWWGMSADQMETVSASIQVPLGFTQPMMELSVRAKRPTAPFNLARAIVDRFTGLLFSEQRHPDVSWEGDSDTEQLMEAIMEQALFWPKWRQARAIGGSTGSVLLTAHLRDGKFNIEVHNTKTCQVLWKDRRTLTPEAVLICYQFQVMEPVVDERTGEIKGQKPAFFLYRRIITEQDDTVYKPVKLEPGNNVTWEVESTVKHSLGFFPGVWIQNLPALENEDGIPDCYGAWQNFDTMDRIISQMNKAVLLNLDPTLVLGVDPKVVEQQGGVRKGTDNALSVGQGGSANYLEITGSGVAAGMTVYEMLKKNTLDVVRCVMVDPEKVSGSAQSAKAIEYLYAPMLEKADDLRAQYGDLGVIPLILVMEKMARAIMGKEVDLPDGKKGILALRLPPRSDGVAHKFGPGGYVRLHWGAYFSPTETDKQQAIQNAVAAQTGGAIDKATMIQAIAPLFSVKDVKTLQAMIKKEQDADMAAMGGGGDEGIPYAEPGTPEAGEGGAP